METTVNALKENGHEVVVRDLYALNFQPVLKPEDTSAMKAGETPKDIKTEQEYITIDGSHNDYALGSSIWS